jgi:hypothetical protein
MKWKYYVGSGIGTFSFIHLVGLVEDISPVVYKVTYLYLLFMLIIAVVCALLDTKE